MHFVENGKKDVCLQRATLIFFLFFLSTLLQDFIFQVQNTPAHAHKKNKKVLLCDKRRTAQAVACHGGSDPCLVLGRRRSTSLSCLGYPTQASPLHSDRDRTCDRTSDRTRGTTSQTGTGTRPGGNPHLPWTGPQTKPVTGLGGYLPPPPRPGRTRDRTRGTPPPPRINRQTPVEHYLPHPSDAGGNN